MASPLSPRSNGALNVATTPPKALDAKSYTPQKSPLRQEIDNASSVAETCNSSPFQTDVGTDIGQDNRAPKETDLSPVKRPRSKSRSRSPSKFDIHCDHQTSLQDPPLPPFRVSPKKQQHAFNSSTSSASSPFKVPLPPASPEKDLLDSPHDPPVTPSATRKKRSRTPVQDDHDMDTRSVASDDTCFSNFSAVPNADMTLLAKLGNRSPADAFRSPTKNMRAREAQTPNGPVFMTPATSRKYNLDGSSRPASPTPRGNKQAARDGDTTNLLLDFTQQVECTPRSRRSPEKMNTEPNLLAYFNNQRNPSPVKDTPRTPGGRKNILNLLDFDLPPQPTPRSVPSITVRELESLKSSYLSEISSLKASLSGREAEVGSLKKAVTDAERRVGEALENVREEKSARDHAENLKEEWAKKGHEVETLLNNVKQEFLEGEKEREELWQKLEESNKAREEAELKAAESATKANVAQSDFNGRSSNPSATDALVASKVAQQLDEKMENLARELHAVYKKKHESKVATLKKTYETRSEKRVHEMQHKIDELQKQNEDLQAVKESHLSVELPENRLKRISNDSNEQQKAEMEEQRAKIAGLVEEMGSVRDSHAQLLKDLERERVEKGELVAAVDEMLALQSEVGAPSAIEDFRKSISRPSGLKGPGFGESKIGRAPGVPTRSVSGSKSRMMSNIERMGGGRTAG